LVEKPIILAFMSGPSEISLVLGPSDAVWLSEEMAFLSELYRSKAGASERQFGQDNNAAFASFWETALKCQKVSVTLQMAVRRGQPREDDRRGDALQITDQSHRALPSPNPDTAGSTERQTRPKRARRKVKAAAKKKRGTKRPTLTLPRFL
jgi:hypothetical protein